MVIRRMDMVNEDENEDEDGDGKVNDEEDDNQVRLPRRQPRQSQLRRLARVSSGIVRLLSISPSATSPLSSSPWEL